MNSIRSTNVRQQEESRSAHSEDHDSILRSRTEEEKQRRRREWQRQQERERQHERLKQQKILEYEKRRAQALGYPEPKSLHRSRSKSSSKSPSHYRHRGRSMTSTTSKSGTLFEKLDESASGTVPLFKGPEGIQISTTELRRIKVDIRRNIPVKGPISELQRSIVNAEDVVLKRREGEGTKPIFDREEIKKSAKNNEVEEQRTVVAIDGEQSVSTSKPQTSKKRSSSLSPTYNSGYQFSQSRYRTDSKLQDRTEFRDHYKNNGRSSTEKHREYKEKYTERNVRKYNTNRSRSRERDSRKSHSRPLIEERSYRDRYRDRSNERFHERRDRDRDKNRGRDRDRSRERRDIAPHYIEPPIHVPIYYNYPSRPIVVSPMVPFRGQVPPMGRGRHSLMAPVRPYPPRFIPPDMYRLGPPPANPRYGPF